MARHYRLHGAEARFQTGADENSLKSVPAADLAGLPVAELVASNAARFLALKESLDLSFDDLIRTSAEPRHRLAVERLWRACFDKGDIYKRSHRGLYRAGCEQFYKPDELHDGRCPEHGAIAETIEEENWFFRLSRYREQLLEL